MYIDLLAGFHAIADTWDSFSRPESITLNRAIMNIDVEDGLAIEDPGPERRSPSPMYADENLADIQYQRHNKPIHKMGS